MLSILLARHRDYHPGEGAALIMKELFERQGFARCSVAEREEAFRRPLSRYDVVVMFCVTRRLRVEEERRICSFVRDGGGLVGLHGAADCSPSNRMFLDMLGAEFLDHEPNIVEWPLFFSDRDHPLAYDMADFAISDEFYQLKVRDARARVFLSFMRRGAEMPLALTKSYGKGRVFYCGLGHHEGVFRNPSFRRLLTRGVAFAAGTRSEKRRPVGVGILGFRVNSISTHHARLLQRVAGLKLIGACDRVRECREHAAGEFDVKVYAQHRDMLADDDVRLVVIALPHHLHCREALRAIEAGRHVVVEKPFALSSRQADRMLEAAERRNVTLTCFQCRRWDHHYLAARRLLEEYENIGDIFEIRLDLGGYSPPARTWHGDRKLSGGNMYAMGAHGIDWILNLMNRPGPNRADPGPVAGVSGYVMHRQWRMATNETHGRIVIRFAGGEVATYCDSGIHAGRHPESLEILGTRGSITFPNVFDEEMQWTRVVDGRQVHCTTPCPGDEWSWAEFYHLLSDHLHFGVPQPVTPESAARVVAVIEAAYRSARMGREVAFRDRYFERRL